MARADVICISIGGNNFLQGGVVELLTSAVLQNDFTLADEIIAGVYESFSDSLAVIKELNPDAALIVQKLYNPRSDAFKEAYQQVMNRLNATFERILEENPGSFVLLDVPSVINGHPGYINADTIHPNKLGHYQIACLLISTLYEMGIGTASEPLSDSKPVAFSFFDKIADFFSHLFELIRNLFNR